jgi:serine/threonine protein kinase
VGANDTFILTGLTSEQALSAAEARGVVGWWTGERLAGESLTDFLLRREVLAPAVQASTHILENGPVAPRDAVKLIAPRGIEQLRRNLGLTERRVVQPSLVNCLARPPQRGRDLADHRQLHSPHGDRPAAPAVRAGTLLGKYLLTEQIGRGASCLVFRALHRALNLTVAIKVMPFESDPDDPTVREQFRAEARLQARLDHPNIVRVLDFEDEAALPYLVLEYVEGTTLAEKIACEGRLPSDQALKIILQIVEALAAVHQMGIVHRDVKPGNILLSASGDRAKLADLGLALVVGLGRAMGAADAYRDTVVGTAGYIAPEQALSAPAIDHRADIYSLGATLYHALTGKLPFTGRSRLEVLLKHTQEAPVPPDQLVPELGPGISAVILKMMAKDPASRQQTYSDLLVDLRSLVRLLPAAPGAPAAPASAEAFADGTITDSRTALNSSTWRKWLPLRPKAEGRRANEATA